MAPTQTLRWGLRVLVGGLALTGTVIAIHPAAFQPEETKQ
jgi:hypothetical protein